jgi:hypothetical protein
VSVVTVIIAIGVFATAFWLSGVITIAGEAVITAQRTVAAMRDPTLDDRAREDVSRRASLRLGSLFAAMVFRTAIVMTVSFVPIWLAGALGLAGTDGVVTILAQWQTGVAASVAAAGAYVLWMRLWPTS